MQTLKPCPFCGASDVKLLRRKLSEMSWVSCNACGLDAPSETGDTNEKAVAYWNTRPAAPVEGLETTPLKWVHHDGNYPTWRSLVPLFRFEAVIDKGWPRMYGKFPLRINGTMSKEQFDTLENAQAAANARFKALALECYRSSGLADQAEAIVAAERSEKLKWMEEGFAKQEQVWSLEAENAALTARVKELDDECNELVKTSNEVVGQRDHAMNLCAQMEEEKEALETQLAAAKKALEEVKAIAWQRETLPTEKASKEIHRNTAYALCGRLGEIITKTRAALEAKP